jgi:hypothetical protein
MDFGGAAVLEKIHMLTIYIMLVIFTTANAVWSVLSWREHMNRAKLYRDKDSEIVSLKLESEKFLQKARTLAQEAATEKEYLVCSVCKRIVVRHELDDDGSVHCINCAAKKVLVNG